MLTIASRWFKENVFYMYQGKGKHCPIANAVKKHWCPCAQLSELYHMLAQGWAPKTSPHQVLTFVVARPCEEKGYG